MTYPVQAHFILDKASHFDEALNSLLLLGYVALRQGDAAGLQCFGGDDRFLPPRKGLSTINRLLNFSYDLAPTPQAPDYMSAVKKPAKTREKTVTGYLVNKPER